MWGSLCLDLCFVPQIFLVQFIPEYLMISVQVSSVQSLSHVRLFVTPWAEAFQASLSLTNSQNLLKLMSFESVMPSNYLILCSPLLLLLSIFPSIRVFPNESVLHIRWPKHWSFSFNISPSNEYSGLISFRVDWFDLLAVQGTLKSLLQYQSSKASIWMQRKNTNFKCSLLVYRNQLIYLRIHFAFPGVGDVF